MGETTQGERESGREDSGQTGIGAKPPRCERGSVQNDQVSTEGW